MRSRKLKAFEKKIDRYAAVIEGDPAACAGQWVARFMPHARAVELDLGCGKGSFTWRSAAQNPDVLYVGIDREKGCVAIAAKRALESGVPNAVFAVGDASNLAALFAPGELDRIHVNFCTPYPPAKQAPWRLTHISHLATYCGLLKPGGTVRFKTDHVPLFDYALTQFELGGYELLWSSRDVAATHPDEVRSDYEELLSAKGARIHALEARPPASGTVDAAAEQTAPQGLVSYLPEDLEHLPYVPYGMEDTVRNLINRKNNEAARAARHAAAEAQAARSE
jgi:tRNA (guanine-N7-)-methyltransferase